MDGAALAAAAEPFAERPSPIPTPHIAGEIGESDVRASPITARTLREVLLSRS